MRASRLLAMLAILQARGQATAQQLAAELEVSVRTVYRDAEALRQAGIPLRAEAGPAGGYRLLDGFRTRLTGLTEPEARALFLTSLPGPAADLGLGAAVAAAQVKLAAALPAGLAEHAERARERFHLDASGWYTAHDRVPHLAAVAGAVWEQRRIQVRYSRWAEPDVVDRTLDPYGLVLKNGRWYVVAARDGRPRTYRVSQILRLSLLDEIFTRPGAFSLARYWSQYLADFHAWLYQGEAVIRLTAEGRERVPLMMSAAVVAAVAATGTPDGPDGSVRAVVPIESLAHAESEFLRLGTDVVVLEPARLRQRLAATAAALSRRYAGPPGR